MSLVQKPTGLDKIGKTHKQIIKPIKLPLLGKGAGGRAGGEMNT